MPYESCVDCGIEKTGLQRKKPRCRSCSQKGNTFRRGKTLSPEQRAQISASHTGMTASLETRRNMSITRGGDGDLENRRYPGLAQWTRAVKRNFPCCVICRSTEALEAHHIAPKAMYPGLATFQLNGLTLCYDCHRGTNGVHNKREV